MLCGFRIKDIICQIYGVVDIYWYILTWLAEEFTWLFVDVGGFGGGPDGLCCDSDLKNISRLDCS